MSDLVGKVVFNATVTRRLFEFEELEWHEAISPYHGGRYALETHRPVSGAFLEGVKRSAKMGTYLSTTDLVLAPVDIGTLDDGRFYILRGLPTGARLADLLTGPMLVARALGIARSLALACATIHARGYSIGKLRCETVFVEEASGGEHVRLFDFRFVRLNATDDHQQIDIRQCATILYELASGLRLTNASIWELRRVPKAIQALLEKAHDGGFETAADFATALGEHPSATPPIPTARLIVRPK